MFYSFHENVNAYKDPLSHVPEPEQTFMEIQLTKGIVYLELYKVAEGRYCMKESFDYVRGCYALSQYVNENRERLNNTCNQKSMTNRFGSHSANSLYDNKRLPLDNFYMDSKTIFGFDNYEKEFRDSSYEREKELRKHELLKYGPKSPIRRVLTSAKKSREERAPIVKFQKKVTSSSVDRNSIRISSASTRIRNGSQVGSITYKDDRDKILSSKERTMTESNIAVEGPTKQWIQSGTARGENRKEMNDEILKKISLKLRSKLKNKTEEQRNKIRNKSNEKNTARSRDLSITANSFDLGNTRTTTRTQASTNQILYDAIDDPSFNQIKLDSRKNNGTPYDYYDHLYDSMRSRPADVITSKTEGNIEVPYDVEVNFPYEVPSPIKSGHGRVNEVREIITNNRNPSFPYEGYNHAPLQKTYFPRGNYLLTCDWDGIVKQYSLQDLS